MLPTTPFDTELAPSPPRWPHGSPSPRVISAPSKREWSVLRAPLVSRRRLDQRGPRPPRPFQLNRPRRSQTLLPRPLNVATCPIPLLPKGVGHFLTCSRYIWIRSAA